MDQPHQGITINAKVPARLVYINKGRILISTCYALAVKEALYPADISFQR